jgi:hypothetical protein
MQIVKENIASVDVLVDNKAQYIATIPAHVYNVVASPTDPYMQASDVDPALYPHYRPSIERVDMPIESERSMTVVVRDLKYVNKVTKQIALTKQQQRKRYKVIIGYTYSI